MSIVISKELLTKQYNLLVKLRSLMVGQLQTLPFTVYDDKTIKELLKAQPKSLDELCKIKGFPKNGKRVSAFGSSIVAIFTDTDSIVDFNAHGEGESICFDTELKRMDIL